VLGSIRPTIRSVLRLRLARAPSPLLIAGYLLGSPIPVESAKRADALVYCFSASPLRR